MAESMAHASLRDSGDELEMYLAQFAEAWASGREAIAIGCAMMAEKVARPGLVSSVKRMAARTGVELVWPCPGSPEADEAVGWNGWYGGGWGGALA